MATLDELQQQMEALRQRVDAITAPPTDYYTQRYSGEETDRGVEIALGLDPDGTGIVTPEHGGTGADTTQAALAALGAGVRPNELDNPYFVGGGTGWGVFPVNQHGLTSYGPGTALDRWTCDGNVVIGEENVSFNSVFYQNVPWSKMERFLGKSIALSVFFDENNAESGTVTLADTYQSQQIVPTSTPNLQLFVNPNGGSQLFRYANGASPKAVKCEEGTDQTLFYEKSDGTYALLPQSDMDYSMQLLKCQQYQIPLSAGLVIPSTVIQTNYIDFFIPTPIQMRATPVIDTATFAIVDNTTGAVYSDFSCAIVGSFANGVAMRATKASHGIASAGAFVNTSGMLNANL